MLADRNPRLDLGRLLDATETASPLDCVAALGAELASVVGASELSFLIADYGGRSLVRLSHVTAVTKLLTDSAGGPVVALAGTVQGDTLRTQQVQVRNGSDGVRIYAPVSDRGEAVGVLEMTLPDAPDEQTMAYVGAAAHALAYVVIANRRYTDLFEWGQRTRPPALEAEIQRRLLPASFTCEGAQFTVAGWVEPADTVGGDTFDYTLDRDVLHMSISDAMGHGVAAALLATLLLAELRNSRRRGLGLLEQARAGNDAVHRHAASDQFVTGQLLRLDLATGVAGVVNAGHTRPLLVRDGTVSEIVLEADPPFGVAPDTNYQYQELALQPGDRLVLLTDGMVERNAAGAALRDSLTETLDLHPRETVHELANQVLSATGGHLSDDATVFVLDWYGTRLRDRDMTAGATHGRASN